MAVTLLCLTALLAPSHAAEKIVSFDNRQQEQLYQSLLREYRCLKCQNQNLADSNASLAADLRREIREQILAGNGKSDIDRYLVARYGDFVLYRPRFNATTAVLWLGPFILLFIALGTALLMIRRRSNERVTGTDRGESTTAPGNAQSERLARARQLLDE